MVPGVPGLRFEADAQPDDQLMAEHVLSACQVVDGKAASRSQQARLSRKRALFGRDQAWIGLIEP